MPLTWTPDELAEEQLAMRERWWREPKDKRKRAAGRQTPSHRLKKQSLLDAQAGRCAICENPFKRNHHVCYDHDHVTGQWRALLCHGCNTRLGHIESVIRLSPWVLKAILYLRKHGSAYRINSLDYPS